MFIWKHGLQYLEKPYWSRENLLILKTEMLLLFTRKRLAIIGHVPYNLAPYLSQFLSREDNKAFASVTGERVNSQRSWIYAWTRYSCYVPSLWAKSILLAISTR